jgi:hypothetical protein
MATVTLYCRETPELKLGPGVRANSPDLVTFVGGYAELDTEDPMFKAKMSWIGMVGTPFIRVLGTDETPTNAAGVVICPECKDDGIDRAFPSEKSLNGHLIQHRMKKG